ncbi:MAG: hypothetical protein WCF66_14365 [Pseudolabrys sp.]
MATVTSVMRIRRCGTCIALLFFLTSCGEKWSISKILVNPQPLPGNATVFPVELIAPPVPLGVSSRDVVVEVFFERVQGYTNKIFFFFKVFQESKFVGQHGGSATSGDHGSAVLMQASCTRVGGPGEPSVQLDIIDQQTTFHTGGIFSSASGKKMASLQFEIEVSSGELLTSSDPPPEVTARATEPLTVTCYRDPPIN